MGSGRTDQVGSQPSECESWGALWTPTLDREALPLTGDVMVVGETAVSRVLCRKVTGFQQLEVAKKEDGCLLEPGMSPRWPRQGRLREGNSR